MHWGNACQNSAYPHILGELPRKSNNSNKSNNAASTSTHVSSIPHLAKKDQTAGVHVRFVGGLRPQVAGGGLGFGVLRLILHSLVLDR